MNGPQVELNHLGKTFPGAARPALRDITAAIPAGVVTGLVGPDGAGKSTLLRLIAGLLAPTTGQIKLPGSAGVSPATLGETGRAATERWPARRRRSQEPGPSVPPDPREFIGYMPQKFGLYEDLTVAENLNLHADLRGVLGAERETAFKRLLDFTDLARFTTRLAGKLSGGMKQKLGLACALLGRPRLLLLDEPGVGVDPISRRELWKMVHELVGEGLTVIWSTAYLDEAEMCQEVLLLNEGELLFAGKPSELTARVKGRCWRVRNLQGSRRQLLARALRQSTVMDGVIQGQSIRMLLKPGASEPDPATLAAGPNAKVEPTPPRFEDAFIDTLGGGPGGDSALAQRLPQVGGLGETVVEAANLTKQFGSFVAADNITFTVKRGEVFGLLGPNGAGKSTTFRMLCGLLLPTSGNARIMGISLRESPSKARQRLGYMAQKFSLYGNLTVEQNLDFFSGAYGLYGSKQKRAVSEMVEIFKLQPLLKSSTDALPLGFKQRLALACAVMHQPDIVFLDEPTSGVDPVTRREFWTHINGVVEKGVTIVVTTHFMDEAEYCDRIALVYRGRIIAAGSPDELKAQAATPKVHEPSMEDAFIELIHKEEGRRDAGAPRL